MSDEPRCPLDGFPCATGIEGGCNLAEFCRAREADGLEPGKWCGCGETSCGFHRALAAAQRKIAELEERNSWLEGQREVAIQERDNAHNESRELLGERDQQFATIDRLREVMGRLIKSVRDNHGPVRFDLTVELDIAEKALSSTPPAKPLVSRRVLKDIYEEYIDRRSQFGSEYLWKKHEQPECIDAAKAELDRTAPREGK